MLCFTMYGMPFGCMWSNPFLCWLRLCLLFARVSGVVGLAVTAFLSAVSPLLYVVSMCCFSWQVGPVLYLAIIAVLGLLPHGLSGAGTDQFSPGTKRFSNGPVVTGTRTQVGLGKLNIGGTGQYNKCQLVRGEIDRQQSY